MKIQQQSFTNVLRSRCSKNFRKFHCKTATLVFLFDKAEGSQPCNFITKRLEHRCFPVKFVRFLTISFPQYASSSCFLKQNLFKDLLAISLAQTNPWSTTTFTIINLFENVFTYQKFPRKERFYNDLDQISFFLISNLPFFCASK